MADNYLEKKMDDLRSGRLTAQSRERHVPGNTGRRGYLSVRFPERRVLVAGAAAGLGGEVAVAFRKAGCKAALFDSDKERGDVLAHDEGLRFYNVNAGDAEALGKALDNLLNAWRDIDVIIVDTESINGGCSATDVIAAGMAQWRARYPFTNSFGGRLITISSDENGTKRPDLSDCGFTVNHIAIKGDVANIGANVARICTFLAEPDAGVINGAVIPAYG